MVEGAGSVEASVVFEQLFNDYLARQVERGRIFLYLKKIEALRKILPILEGVEVDNTGKVSLNLHNWDAETIVKEMSIVYDSLIEIDAFTEGGEIAFQKARESLENVQKQFSGPYSRLKINDYILRGLLRGNLTTGIAGMDVLLDGGIPDQNLVLLLGPPGSEKFHFAFQYLAEGLRKGDAGVIAVSSISIKEAKSRLTQLKVNISSCEKKDILKFVDWYTQKSKANIGMEERDAVFLPSKDIANLDIALMASLEKLEFSPTKRGIFDLITSALNAYDISEVTEFLQRQKTRLKRAGITSLFIVEQGAHDERILATLKHISDGVIIISKDKDGAIFIQVESMENSKFDSSKHAVQLSRKGLAVVEEFVDETGTISDFCTILGVDREIARNLIDAGFTDLEKLNLAEREELIEVQGITDEICTTILEYMGSVDYSHRVLSKKSEKWLKRGIEQAAAGIIDKAKMSLNRAIEIDYVNTKAWLELSKIYYEEGNEEESRKCYGKAVSIDPNVSASWLEGDSNG
jgi:KaiC/GvpD/RAD55 family RecA-like ATPase